MLEPIAFLSYTRFDDAHDEERIAWFCERLSGEVKMQTGQPFPIFRDKKDIQWGQRWRERIEECLDEAVFLIPILTPSYFQSQPCREEYELFREREKKLKRNDLILPVYYVECDELEDPAIRESNLWAKDLSERQYEDWRSLRWKLWDSPSIGRALERLAKQIKQALKTTPGKAVSRPVREPKAMEGELIALGFPYILTISGTWKLTYGPKDNSYSEIATIHPNGEYYVGGRLCFHLRNFAFDPAQNAISYDKIRTNGTKHHTEVLAIKGFNLLEGHRKGNENHLLRYERKV